MFFSELQETFNYVQKQKAIMKNSEEARREEVIEEVLMPIIEKNFAIRQKISPDASEFSLRVFVPESGTEFWIQTEKEDNCVYEYDFATRLARKNMELKEEDNLLVLFRTICKIAPRLFYGFSGLENEEAKEKYQDISVFEFLLTLTTPEYEKYLETL